MHIFSNQQIKRYDAHISDKGSKGVQEEAWTTTSKEKN